MVAFILDRIDGISKGLTGFFEGVDRIAGWAGWFWRGLFVFRVPC
jgi:hypothetical protein